MEAVNTRGLLRKLSRPWHEHAEAIHWTGSSFHGLAGYRRFLNTLLQAHSELGWPAVLLIGNAHSQNHEQALIRHLCCDLGQQPRKTTQESKAISTDFAWGVVYALTGSAMGASAILASGAVQPHWPKNYLSSVQAHAQSGSVRRFFDRLNQANPGQEQALAGVNAVFQIMSGHPPQKWSAAL